MADVYRTALEEIGAAIDGIDGPKVDAICRRLAGAGTIVVYGCGREALQVKGFAMRLFHLGMNVAVVGDMTCPPVGAGDVFFTSSGPGETSTVLTLMEQARAAGALVIVVTAERHGSAAGAADEVLLIPAQTMASDQGQDASTVLPMGSVFEGALFVLFESIVLKLRGMLSETPETMRVRHTNME